MLYAAVIKTERPKKKERQNFRVTNDDQRRYREQWQFMTKVANTYNPYAVGVEAFVTNQAASNAWKVTIIYGGVLFWAWERGMYACGFLPSDIKRRFAGKLSASKGDVGVAIKSEIQDVDQCIAKIPAGQQEHVFDAAGHATLVLDETDRIRSMLGMR